MTVAVFTPICAAAVHFKLPVGMRTMSLSTSNFQEPDALACTGERTHALQKTHSPHSRDDAKKKMFPASIVTPSREKNAQSPRCNVAAPDRTGRRSWHPPPCIPKCCTNECIILAVGGWGLMKPFCSGCTRNCRNDSATKSSARPCSNDVVFNRSTTALRMTRWWRSCVHTCRSRCHIV